MFLTREIFWHDLTPERLMDTRCLRFDPHPQDFDITCQDWPEMSTYMNSRMADLNALLDRLGEGKTWGGSFREVNPLDISKSAEVRADIVDAETHIVATLATRGIEIPEILVIVPFTRVNQFEPSQINIAGGLAPEISRQMSDIAYLFKCGSLVFALNTVSPVARWMLPGGEADDFRPTLTRAILRWAIRRDGICLADLADERYGRNGHCSVCKDRTEGCYRFTVRHPCGTEFSNAFVRILRDLGYKVVDHPDFNFDTSDTAEWFASKNQEHLDEVIRFLEAADPAADGFDDAVEKKLLELGDVADAVFDWKCFCPADFAESLGNQLGIKIRWSEGGFGFDGTQFFQFLVEV